MEIFIFIKANIKKLTNIDIIIFESLIMHGINKWFTSYRIEYCRKIS